MKASKDVEMNKDVDLLKLAKEIKAETGIKLYAESPTDDVDGYLISYKGKVSVHTYDDDEAPNKGHKSNVRKKMLSPSEKGQITAKINAHVRGSPQ